MRQLIVIALILSGCRKPTTADPAWEAGLTKFHAEYTEEIAGDDGWLTIVGRFELKRGANVVGSGSSADIVLPADRSDEVIGTLTVTDGDALKWAPSQGEAIELADDKSGDATIISHGSLRMHVISRGTQHFLRVKDREHPARKEFAGLTWYPNAPAWRITARFSSADAGTVAITNVLNRVVPLFSPGTIRFEVNGTTHTLVALTDDEAPTFFVIFKDETAGHGTYPAGRFVHTSAPRPDGTVELDFNRAYSPPCAFTAFATCPLPPKENFLPLKIEAGERFDGH